MNQRDEIFDFLGRYAALAGS